LNSFWKEKIKNLNNIVQACNQDITRREDIFKILMEVDLVEITDEVQDPKLILNSLFLTKKQFDEKVENAIDNWLVDYSIKNQNIEEILHGISIDIYELEGKLFNIKI
jgi:hypothetical protein